MVFGIAMISLLLKKLPFSILALLHSSIVIVLSKLNTVKVTQEVALQLVRPLFIFQVRYGSPTSWDVKKVGEGAELCLYDSDVESDLSSSSAGVDTKSEHSDRPVRKGLRITFMNDYLAMAEDDTDNIQDCMEIEERIDWQWQENNTVDLEVSILSFTLY